MSSSPSLYRGETLGRKWRRWWRAFPTLLQVGAAETLAYRAEFIVWMLTTTLPLVMLGLWTSVAREGAFAHYQTHDFVAYYLITLVVRNVTGSWVVWQLDDEIRRGTLSLRLLRPIHPFLGYAALHLSAVPLRAVVAMPATVVLMLTQAREVLALDLFSIALFLISLGGAWVLTFFVLVSIGCLAFFLERSVAVFDAYLGVFAVLSGYLIPLDLLPSWAQSVAAVSPFRFMLSFPVELMMGVHEPHEALLLLMAQMAYAAAAVASAALLWRAGIRRYEAFGS